MKTYSKLWLGLLGSGLFASFCVSSIAGDFPHGSTSVTGTVAPTVAKEQDQKKKKSPNTQSQGAVASLSAKTGIPQDELKTSLVKSTQPSHQLSASPSATLAAPMGFGADYGQAFVGLSGITRDPSSDTADGTLAWGFGLGDANRYVGATVGFAIDSLNPSDGGIGGDGSLSLALTRNLPWMSAVSIGATRLGSWGNAGMSRTPSYYAAFSKMFVLRPDNAANPMPLTISFGGGNGYFRKIHDQNQGKDSVGYFGAVALEFHPRASVIVDYTGSVLTPGISVVPLPNMPMTISVGLYDINNQYDDKISVIGSIGYAFTY